VARVLNKSLQRPFGQSSTNALGRITVHITTLRAALAMAGHRTSRRSTVVVSGVVALALMAAAFSAGRVAAAPAASFKFVTDVVGMSLKAQASHADGTVTAEWSSSAGSKVVVSGVPGATVTVHGYEGSSGYMGVDVAYPPVSKELAGEAVGSYAAAGRSVYQDALRVGFSDAAARGIANGLQPNSYQSACVSTSGPGGYSTGRFCNVSNIVSQNAGDWYLADEGTGTAHDSATAPGTGLLSFLGYTYYGANNVLVKWAPAGTINPSACRSDTEQISYGGVSWSSSSTICPDRIDPSVNPNGPSFGEFWHGFTHDYVGLDPVDIMHSPANATANFNVHVYIHWQGV
jgi:hypothetical protein